MSNISKINNIDIGDIVNINGISKGNVSNIIELNQPHALYLKDTKDTVSNNSLSTLIPGTRYDLVNSVQTAFTTNTPVLTEKGIRTVGAYQNLCRYSEDVRNEVWIKSTNCTTPSYDTISGFSLAVGERIYNRIQSGILLDTITFTASLEVKASGEDIGKNITVALRRYSGADVSYEETFVLSGEWVKHSITFTTLADTVGIKLICKNLGVNSADTFNIRNVQVSQKKYVHPYIPTTSSTAASVSESGTVVAGEATNGIFADEIATNFATLNSALQDQGTLTLDWTPGYSAADVTGSMNILSFNGVTSHLRYNKTTGAIELYDGFHTASLAITPVANTKYTIKCSWKELSMQVCIDGSAGTTAVFSGFFNPGSDVVCGLGNAELQYVNNLRVFKEPQWV